MNSRNLDFCIHLCKIKIRIYLVMFCCEGCTLTARRLALVNVAESTRGRLTNYTFCMTSSPRPSGAKHGAVFAITVQFGFELVRSRYKISDGLVLNSRYRIWFEATGAVSRYKLPAEAIIVSRYRILQSGQMSVSRLKGLCSFPV